MKFQDLKTFTQAFYAPEKQCSSEFEAPNLFFLNGKNEGLVVSCDTEATTIGRSLQSKVHLNSPKISKNHCEVIKNKNLYFIIDHNSKNGTYLNKKRIPAGEKKELTHGDILNISDVTCLFIHPLSSFTQKKIEPIVIDKDTIANEASELLEKYKHIIKAVSSKTKK